LAYQKPLIVHRLKNHTRVQRREERGGRGGKKRKRIGNAGIEKRGGVGRVTRYQT